MLVAIERWKYPFPFRTRKSSTPSPMILPKGGKVGRCQLFFCLTKRRGSHDPRRFFFALRRFRRTLRSVAWAPRSALAPEPTNNPIPAERARPWTPVRRWSEIPAFFRKIRSAPTRKTPGSVISETYLKLPSKPCAAWLP